MYTNLFIHVEFLQYFIQHCIECAESDNLTVYIRFSLFLEAIYVTQNNPETNSII